MTSKVDIKVVLLGKEFGGKTSLVERFVNHRFIERPTHRYQATIGAAYASRKIQPDPKGKAVEVAIWDTAGSERYEAMSRMYYRNARAAIVCYDLSDSSSFDRVKFWVSELKEAEESCKIYICGTKCDLVSNLSDRPIDARSTSNYATAIEAKLFETSSKTGDGVDELFTTIARDFLNYTFETDETRTNVIREISNKSFFKKPDCMGNRCLP